MAEACRTTQHCAYHGWCHRCDGQFSALMSEINVVIQSSKAQPGAWGELYERIAKALHGDERVTAAIELAEARQTIQRLNHRAQVAESKLATVERAVGEWRVDEGSVFLPLPSLMAVARTVGKTMEVGNLVSYHEKIEELQEELERLGEQKRRGEEA